MDAELCFDVEADADVIVLLDSVVFRGGNGEVVLLRKLGSGVGGILGVVG